MPSRRIKSIMHGTAPSTRVYHREHRSKRGRVPKWKYKMAAAARHRREEQKLIQMEEEIVLIESELNNE